MIRQECWYTTYKKNAGVLEEIAIPKLNACFGVNTEKYKWRKCSFLYSQTRSLLLC